MAREVTRADTRQSVGAEQAFQFLTPHEGRTIQAAMARIFPDDELGAGAVEAGAVYYLDRALAGAEHYHQGTYRTAVQSLDALAQSRFGAQFGDCNEAQQDALIGEMAAEAEPRAEVGPGEAPTGLQFFELLRAHTLEGMFSDPVHGGNRNLAGWSLLGYPGPQPGYTHEEQQLDAVVVRDRMFTAADYPLAPDEEAR